MFEVMQSSLTEANKLQIADELEKLFTLQDRPFNSKKSAAFIDEFGKSNLPIGAIIAGLRSLMTAEDISDLKFPRLAAAARSKIERNEIKTSECEHCFRHGLVMMTDSSGYEFSFACNCGNAAGYQGLNLATWNGDAIQIHRGKTLRKRFA